ncbi:MAG: hypothetical protein ABI134_32205 [Byssovorax sp.]
MYRKFSRELKWQRITVVAAVLTCAAIVYAAAGCCGTNEFIIYDDCLDAGVTDGGDAGSDNGEDSFCN